MTRNTYDANKENGHNRLSRKGPQNQRNRENTMNPIHRDGRLRNSNPCGNPFKAPRCGGRTRRGSSCQAPAMKNGRCRMHGGPSTGPKTPEGLARSRKANWKTGKYSAEAKTRDKVMRAAFWILETFGVLPPLDGVRIRKPSAAAFEALWAEE